MRVEITFNLVKESGEVEFTRSASLSLDQVALVRMLDSMGMLVRLMEATYGEEGKHA